MQVMMGTISMWISGLLCVVGAAAATNDIASAPASRPAGILPATVTVDSSWPGYGFAVLSDGKWFEKGQEDPGDYTASRLGNGGNTWVSAEGPVEHWISLDWPQPVALDELVIWWSLAEW